MLDTKPQPLEIPALTRITPPELKVGDMFYMARAAGIYGPYRCNANRAWNPCDRKLRRITYYDEDGGWVGALGTADMNIDFPIYRVAS